MEDGEFEAVPTDIEESQVVSTKLRLRTEKYGAVVQPATVRIHEIVSEADGKVYR